MTREQLEHVIRAAASVTNEHSFVVLGSQSVLCIGTLDAHAPPVAAIQARARRRAQPPQP
jgi:hypothetical protein